MLMGKIKRSKGGLLVDRQVVVAARLEFRTKAICRTRRDI